MTEFAWQFRDWPGAGGSEYTTDLHAVGHTDCPACCCGKPERCDECGGLLHNEAAELTGSGEPERSSRCDLPCSCLYCEASAALEQGELT